jgi:hypothetical protein
MRLNSSHLASILAGAGLAAPGLTFGAWAFRDMPEGIALMDRPGLTLSFLLLLIAPVFILGFGLLGRVVISFLDEDDEEKPEPGRSGPEPMGAASGRGRRQATLSERRLPGSSRR